MPARLDAVVVGAGPNGLAAAVALAEAGLAVRVIEARDTPGGGARTSALTVPGFLHDVCSAVHPLAVGSPWFRALALDELGLTWIHPPAPLAHAPVDGRVITLERSIDDTAAQLGPDAAAYRALMAPLVARFDALVEMILAPLLPPSGLLRSVRHPGARRVPVLVVDAARRRGARDVRLLGRAQRAVSRVRPPGAGAGYRQRPHSASTAC